MKEYEMITMMILTFAAAAISILTEQVPLVRKWWRETLDEEYTPEEADTIRLGVQVIVTVAVSAGIYLARAYGTMPGGQIDMKTMLLAAGAALVAVLTNQGTFHVVRKWKLRGGG